MNETLHPSDTNLRLLTDDCLPKDIEFFYPNYWYGFSNLIKRYSFWPLPLPFVIPHGLDFGTTNMCGGELQSGLPGIYCYQDFREDIYLKQKVFTLIKGASPWLYLLKLKNFKGIHKDNAFSLIVFPPHSGATIESYVDDEDKFITHIEKMKNNYKDIGICIYWRDILKNRHIKYIEAGFKVFTAGNMYDPYFSDRLFEILKNYKYLYTPTIGSHIFYAASMGIDIILDDSFETKYIASDEILRKDLWSSDSSIEKNITNIFTVGTLEQKKQFSLSFLGIKNIKSRIQLFIEILFFSLKNGWILKCINEYKKLSPGSPFIKIDQLKILAWGPQSCAIHSPPNIQVDGCGAIWISTSKDSELISGDLYIGKHKAIETKLQKGLITASFSPDIFNKKVTEQVVIRNKLCTREYFIGVFEII